MADTKVRVIAKSKVREDESAVCDCCGRGIKRLVYLSDGRVVGQTCALRQMGIPKRQVDAAPMIFDSPDDVTGFYGLAWHNGKVVEVTRSYAPGGGYTAPTIRAVREG